MSKNAPKKEQAFNQLMKSGNVPAVADMCQTRITALVAEIAALENELSNKQAEEMPFDYALGYVRDFISRPHEIWQLGNYYDKQGVLNLGFEEQISYDREKKFGTPKLSPIFAVFSENNVGNENWRAQKDSNPQSSDP